VFRIYVEFRAYLRLCFAYLCPRDISSTLMAVSFWFSTAKLKSVALKFRHLFKYLQDRVIRYIWVMAI